MQKKIPLGLRISMYVAFVGGILTPILETIRRWHQMSDLHYFVSWFDDYLIGGFLFFAAWKTHKMPDSGHKYLIAAWGFATGMIFYSFFGIGLSYLIWLLWLIFLYGTIFNIYMCISVRIIIIHL